MIILLWVHRYYAKQLASNLSSTLTVRANRASRVFAVIWAAPVANHAVYFSTPVSPAQVHVSHRESKLENNATGWSPMPQSTFNTSTMGTWASQILVRNEWLPPDTSISLQHPGGVYGVMRTALVLVPAKQVACDCTDNSTWACMPSDGAQCTVSWRTWTVDQSPAKTWLPVISRALGICIYIYYQLCACALTCRLQCAGALKRVVWPN
jgi:hypothetical protein